MSKLLGFRDTIYPVEPIERVQEYLDTTNLQPIRGEDCSYVANHHGEIYTAATKVWVGSWEAHGDEGHITIRIDR